MKQLHKEIILGAIMVLLTVFFWYFLKYVFYIGGLSVGCWISGGILFFLWGISLCLVMLLIRNKAILFGSFVLALLLFFIFFSNKPIYYLVVLLILFASFAFAANRIKKEEEVQVNLNFWRIWKRGLPMLITALILVISMVYYFSPALMDKTNTKIKIPEKLIDAVLNPLESLIQEKLPKGISLDSDADKILPEIQKKELETKFGIKIEKGDTGRKVLYKMIDYQINNITGAYQYLIPLGLAIGLFIVLKIISIFYVGIVIMLSWLALRFLVLIKFARFEKETREVETVKL